jgi:hypothetical protein
MSADTTTRINERDSRVAEWLDDKLQTLADLETLDSLLQDVRSQQTLLRDQVCHLYHSKLNSIGRLAVNEAI